MMKPLTIEHINSVEHKLTNNAEIRINCPECDDTDFHLYVNIPKGVFNCFKCNYRGKIKFDYNPYIGSWSWDDIAERIKKDMIDEHYNNLKKLTESDTIQIKNLPLNLKIVTSANYFPHHIGVQYLLDRGVTFEEIDKYDIRISKEKSGPYKNTVIFPVWDKYDTLEYFVCRKYIDEKPKYINAPWPKKGTLFFAGNSGKDGIVVITEGILDALAVARVGYSAISVLGKTITSEQLYSFGRSLRMNNVLIYLDRDAFTNAVELKLQLSAIGIRTEIISHDLDAAALCVKNAEELERLIYATSKTLA